MYENKSHGQVAELVGRNQWGSNQQQLVYAGSNPALASNKIENRNARTCMFTRRDMDRGIHLLFGHEGVLQWWKKIIHSSSDSPRDPVLY